MNRPVGNMLELTVPVSANPCRGDMEGKLACNLISLLKKRFQGVKYSMSGRLVDDANQKDREAQVVVLKFYVPKVKIASWCRLCRDLRAVVTEAHLLQIVKVRIDGKDQPWHYDGGGMETHLQQN